jgi:hypothetical protein
MTQYLMKLFFLDPFLTVSIQFCEEMVLDSFAFLKKTACLRIKKKLLV